MYTYILKDLKEDIFKIGKTKDPIKRFKDVCIRDRIIPVYLVRKDREKELHEKFEDARITHPEKVSGRTEYFKRGGSFTKTAEWADKQAPIPYLSPGVMVKALEESHTLRYDSVTVDFELESEVTAKYLLGLGILKLLPFKDRKDFILNINGGTAVSSTLIEELKKNFVILVSFDRGESVYIKKVPGIKVIIKKKN